MLAGRSADGTPVAVKVIDLQGLPPSKKVNLVKTYLNEVAHLERLRQETNHVVYIYDFDFDPRYGRGRDFNQ